MMMMNQETNYFESLFPVDEKESKKQKTYNQKLKKRNQIVTQGRTVKLKTSSFWTIR
jgi:hypothetical protein